MSPDYRMRYYRVLTAQDGDEYILIMARNMARAEEKVRAMGKTMLYIVEDF
jgi:hypothetical protein